MKAFKVKGKFLMKDRWQDFTKELAGEDENAVRERIYSNLGSKHRVKRTRIEIIEVNEIPQKDITDSITLFTINNEKKAKRNKAESTKKTKKGESNE